MKKVMYDATRIINIMNIQKTIIMILAIAMVTFVSVEGADVEGGIIEGAVIEGGL